jgi:hypothetical protein
MPKRSLTRKNWIRLQTKSFINPSAKAAKTETCPLLISSDDKTFTAESARKKGKAVVFDSSLHTCGESDGKDAGLALLRDIAITKTRADLLKDVVILFCSDL